MTANVMVRTAAAPLLKGIAKVRLDSTLVGLAIVETTASKLVIDWRTRSAGLGTLRFVARDGKVSCDSERRSEDFVRNVLQKMVDVLPLNQWPALLRAHDGVEGLLRAATPQTPW
jgi:hypothetical protein